MKRKLSQYTIYKISTDKIVSHVGEKTKINDIALSTDEALLNDEMVKIQSNQLTAKIIDICGKNVNMADIIINVVVPTSAKKQGEKDYALIAQNGFVLNGQKYIRLFSGSGQIRRNTITFIRADLYHPVMDALMCGLTIDDFGDAFNAAKYNAYSGLNMSGCHLLYPELSPVVCVVDDMETIKPHQIVNHVTETTERYIVLPDDDYIITDNQTEFDIDGDKATRISDGAEFSIHKGIKKHIKQEFYDDIEDAPNLNSFDGQGLMSPEWAKRVSCFLGVNYVPSQLIIRAPWIKGLLATVPFRDWFSEHGITDITDMFGKTRNIADIDVILSKSQFKMAKIYKAKCAGTGINAWDYHQSMMAKNNLRWGVVKCNTRQDDYLKTLNYQYLQALQLDNDYIDALIQPTKDYLDRLNSDDINEVARNLFVNAKGFIEEDAAEIEEDEDDDDKYRKKLFQRVIESNRDFINDKYIREQIFRECDKKINGAKLGKILVRGNYQFIIADPIAMLEWIAVHHCGADITVKGIIPAGSIYSNYWHNAEDASAEITLMRSPLIDRNEIAKRKIIDCDNPYLRYLISGIIESIHDLTALQMSGSDFDGDIIFSTNNEIISKGCFSFEDAKPLYYSLQSTDLVGKITLDNVIKADVRGLNSAVGSISNKGGSLYANLQNYTPEDKTYGKIYDSIIALGQIVGMEIDRIKTAVAPTMPLEWKSIIIKNAQMRDGTEIPITSAEERKGIYRHNEIVPDVKPYYFRHSYSYLDTAIKQLNKAFDKVSVVTFGMKLSALIYACQTDAISPDMLALYGQYMQAYQSIVIDTDCIVNHISHEFEAWEEQAHKRTIAEGTNMLKNYIVSTKFDTHKTKIVCEIVKAYTRYKRLSARTNNIAQTDNQKTIKKQIDEINQLIREHYHNTLLELFDGDLQICFDYLAKNANENIVFDLLQNEIIEIVRKEK